MDNDVIYRDANRPVEERVADLLSRMTEEEKIAQLKARDLWWGPRALGPYLRDLEPEMRKKAEAAAWAMVNADGEVTDEIMVKEWREHWKTALLDGDAPIGELSCALESFPPREGAELANMIHNYCIEQSRLGIPVLIHAECLHGCVAKGSTSFPQAIGLAATWDPDLMFDVASAIGRESASRGIHHCLSPTINIAADPRCGRTEETYGEDPYLTTQMAVAFVRGVQGEGVAATPKHFVANFAGDGGRDSYDTELSERTLRELYFPAFEACVKAGALSVMAAYNSLNGVPCSADRWLLTEVLRDEWGFKGVVVSDYESVAYLHTKLRTAKDRGEAATQALEAGLDLELPTSDCFEQLHELIENGSLSEKTLDSAVGRMLRLKFMTGLFDSNPADPDRASRLNLSDQHRKLALDAARKSIVLLKNNGTLPLDSSIDEVALIGPNTDTLQLGGYSVFGAEGVTVLQGLVNRGVRINHAVGCGVTGTVTDSFKPTIDYEERFKAVRTAVGRSKAAVLVLGNSPETEGEQGDRSNLDLPGDQEALIQEVTSAGIPTVVILIGGSVVTMERWIDRADAIVEAWYPGCEGGNAIAEVLFGETNPSGKLPIGFVERTGQLPYRYNHRPSGRTDDYADLRGNQFSFPFGHGLSYTKFAYRDLVIEPEQITPDENVEVRIVVENSGDLAGDEVVQLYLSDEYSSISRPIQELVGFRRVHLEPGESKSVRFILTSDAIGYYDGEMRRVVEPGKFLVRVGSSSTDLRATGTFLLME